MKEFRSDLRIRVLTSFDIIDLKILKDDQKRRELDEAIIFWAKRELVATQLCVFFLAFNCTKTWDEVHEEYDEQQGKDTEKASVRRIAKRVIEKLGTCIEHKTESARELHKWKP